MTPTLRDCRDLQLGCWYIFASIIYSTEIWKEVTEGSFVLLFYCKYLINRMKYLTAWMLWELPFFFFFFSITPSILLRSIPSYLKQTFLFLTIPSPLPENIPGGIAGFTFVVCFWLLITSNYIISWHSPIKYVSEMSQFYLRTTKAQNLSIPVVSI